MTALAYERYCDELLVQTNRLRSVLDGADLAAKVPTCPEWTLRDLAVHVGGAHRWAGEMVRTRAAEELADELVPGGGGPRAEGPDTEVPDGAGSGDDHRAALDAWLAEGASATAAALREAGPDAAVWSWGGDPRAAFWARRMTHETVVHLADAALTTGAAYTQEPEVAADTIDEWLSIVLHAQRNGDPEAAELRGGGRSLHLHATDRPGAEWLIEFHEDGFTWRHAHAKATVAVRGTLTDLMLLMNRRLTPGADGLEVLGEAALLDFWLARSSFG
ncbi:maleylpyruvate isomerase family mycothiol-dependent enzyme [Streptomyces sp. NBC_00102]|uniref:maleylpyruvate isomerase family mycothiol-dependent enzyme n=1 Tax=Streptomyces sp. NBC_00102 TaxID=2975652 RepID=UPI0022548718|nr:maleylpyruvate isomerase family mycothiol-dependent enzyme [Streptomyces sp. NBC_00102]MCX5396703.1 maleylpyruvate isomerase N-terminal domain-containing protein [Streptomyces sp. NBC_00102]